MAYGAIEGTAIVGGRTRTGLIPRLVRTVQVAGTGMPSQAQRSTDLMSGPYKVPLCVVCRHLGPFREGRFTCGAFPEGIPEPIMDGRIDHRRPFAGDNGIRFEADPDATPELLAALTAIRRLDQTTESSPLDPE